MNVYAIRMAGVFMISTTTIALRAAVMPRCSPSSDICLRCGLLVGVGFLTWVELLFPAWVFVVSAYLLVAVRRADRSTALR